MNAICNLLLFIAFVCFIYLLVKYWKKIYGSFELKQHILGGFTNVQEIPSQKFLGYWKDTRCFCINKDRSHIENCVPTSDKLIKCGNSFSKSLAEATKKGHKYMALKADSNKGELLTFNQLSYGSKVDYNYNLPSDDHHDKMAGCAKDICDKKYKIPNELWAVYQLYK